MRTVACFGHSMIPSDLFPEIQNTIWGLFSDDPDTEFLVGHQGEFDGAVYHALKLMEREFPDLHYKIVLAYMPGRKEDYKLFPTERTCYPEGMEFVHPRYAITHRNRWMVKECDLVLCYITHPWGGAYQSVQKAKHQGKTIINIAKRDVDDSICYKG